MGLGTILIAIVILVVALPITLSFAGGSIDALLQDLEDKQDAQDFGNNPKKGDVVCDLKIHVEGQLDFDRSSGLGIFNIGNLEVYMGSQGAYPQVVDAKWSNCRKSGTFSMVSFFGNLERIQQLALVQGDSFDLQMQGSSVSNGKPLTENSDTKIWTNNVVFTGVQIPIIELTSVDLPVGWKTDYFLTSVKVDDYQLKFVAVGGSINEKGTNIPLSYTVKKPILT